MSADADDLDDGLEYSFDTADVDEGVAIADQSVFEPEDSEEEPGARGASEKEDKSDKKPSKTVSNKKPNKTEKRAKLQKGNELLNDISKRDPSMIADIVAQKIKKLNAKLSKVELEDLYLHQSAFADTAAFDKERTTAHLADFLSQYLAREISSNHPKEGRKFVVVVSPSAIRVCDVQRALASKKLTSRSIKVIKKNKIGNDVKLLATTQAKILVTNPGRILRLVKDKALAAGQVSAIVVDSSYNNLKNQSIWDERDFVPALQKLKSDGNKIYLY